VEKRRKFSALGLERDFFRFLINSWGVRVLSGTGAWGVGRGEFILEM